MYKAEETTEESTAETTAENTAENTTEATTEEGTTGDGEEAEDNKEEEEETSSIPTSTQRVDYEYSYIPAEIAEWLAAEGRQKGDIGYVTVYAKNSEGEATDDAECYYVVILDNVDEHPEKLVSVRHILVGFEGGTKDEESGETVYSVEEKKAASDEAERIKAEFEGGEKTAEAFGELAKKYSDDNAEAGGLYEDVYPGQMQAPFDEWCFDSARKAGDVGIVETEFGYHVIYFVETQEQTYREYIITNTLRNEEAEEWFNGLREAYKTSAEISNTSFMNTSIILSK